MDMENQLQHHQKPKPEIVLLMDSNETKHSTSSRGVDDTIPKLTTASTSSLSRGGFNLSKPRARFAAESETPPNPKTNFIISDHQDNKEEACAASSSDDSLWSDEEDDASEIDNDQDQLQGTVVAKKKKKKKNYSIFRKTTREMKKRALVEFLLFLIIMICLVCSLTLTSLKHELVWGLEIWKWCLMIMVIFCGRLVSAWVVGFMVLLIERNFMLREKVLYFVFGLRKSFQNCVWLALVLVCWMIMFPEDLGKQKHNAMMKKMFKALVAVLLGATIWLLKIVFVKVLASSFHVATFFDRMKESVFHHYILDALSGPPLDGTDKTELAELKKRLRFTKSLPVPTRTTSTRRTIDMEKLKKLSMSRRTSAWSVKRLVNSVRLYGLSTISRKVDDFGSADSEINNEWGARNCAHKIFKNVAKPGVKYIEEEDLVRFLKSEEVHTVFPLFEGAIETGKISKSSLRNWVVHAYIERKALAHSLNDTKTAVQQLHRLASAMVVVIIIVASLLVMGLATIKVIFVVTSQLLLVGFVFQNTCKTIFESIIFVFVMHPFDVGDRCVVDGVQMVVEEMNILTTVFLRYDMEKIYYPNSVLLTKPISNFRRSPDMGDGVEFTIDVSTPIDHINALKKAIQAYIESKPKYWSPKHSLIFKDIENINKLKVGLYVQHTINHQNYGEKSIRRSDLVFELKKIFENLSIKYNLLPQEVRLTHPQVVG